MRNSRRGVHESGECVLQAEACPPGTAEKADVACLSLQPIEELSDVQLIEVIRAAQLPMLIEERMAHVEFMAREQLKQLACLARQYCRKQTAGHPAVECRQMLPVPRGPLPGTLDKADVACLSLQAIEELSDVQLIEVIRAAQLPMLTEERMAHVEFMAREQLKQLACLARRCCRNQGY